MGSRCDFPATKLTKRVTIQTSTRTTDGQGGFTEAWATGDAVWASIEPVKGWERYQAMQTQTQITHELTTRYRTDITNACRLKYRERVFWVKEVLNVNEQNRFLEIKAVERA